MFTPYYIQHISTPEEVVYDDPEGRFTLTTTLHQTGGVMRTHIHFRIHYWAPSTLKEIDRRFAGLRAGLPEIIAAMPGDPSPTFDKYVRRFNFEKVADIPCQAGLTRPFYIHMRR